MAKGVATVSPEVHISNILRGRSGIAGYMGVSQVLVARLVDAGAIPVWRLSSSQSGLILTTKRLLDETVEREAEKQNSKL